jgi:hypothetical protein
MKKEYSVTQARDNLRKLIAEATAGHDIEILVYDRPYVQMSMTRPDGLIPPMEITVVDALHDWSQLLSAVANNDARAYFIAPSDQDVYLTRVAGYRNLFLGRWKAHKKFYKEGNERTDNS